MDDPTAPVDQGFTKLSFDRRVMRAFVRNGRPASTPVQDRKRGVILRWLVGTNFAEDRDDPEKDVNMCLALVHPDVAPLRLYLVEAGLMTRAAGQSRPSPGPARTEPDAT